MPTPFGGGAQDFAISGGLIIPGAQFLVWDSALGGSQVTALLDAAGATISSPYYVTADANGLLKFSVSTPGWDDPVYIIAVGAPLSWGRVRLDPADMADRVAAASTLATTASAGLTTHSAASDPHTGYQLRTEKNVNNGYAGLDSGGRIQDARLPLAPTITDLTNMNHTHTSASTGGAIGGGVVAGVVATVGPNSATETTICTFTNMIRANAVVKEFYEFVLLGNCDGTNTVTFRFRLTNATGTLLSNTIAITVANSPNRRFRLEGHVAVATSGASGALEIFGRFGEFMSATGQGADGNFSGNVTGVDLTTAKTMVITAQLVSGASNICRGVVGTSKAIIP